MSLVSMMAMIRQQVGLTPAYLSIDENVKIIIDANSIWSDDMGIPGIDALPAWTAFKASSGCLVVNTSIAGQQWFQMANNLADVVAAYDPDMTNVIMSAETRNTIMNGKTYSQCLGEITDYYDNLRSALPFAIPVYMEALPTDGVPSAADENVTIKAVDSYVRDHLDEFGIKKFVRFRDLSAFAGDGASRQGFMKSVDTCLESFPGPYVHPDGFPREQIGIRMVRDVQRIPV